MAWTPPVNYRLTAVVTPTPEAFTIDASGVALLSEAPADPAGAGTPMTVLVGGVPYTRVTGSPVSGSTTFRVKSQTVVYADLQTHTEYLPLLEFHPERATLTGTCNYYRTGTVYTAEWFAAMMAHLTPLVGLADETELPPATTDVTQRGYPGDQAFLEDGSQYFSDGVDWVSTGGGAGTPRTRRPDITADAAVQEQGITRAVPVDARVAELFTRTAVVDADASVAAANERQTSVTVDAAVSGTVLAQVAADAQPVLRSVPAITVDAAVQASITKPLTADAAVLGAVLKYADADAYVDAGAGALLISDSFTGADGAAINPANWTFYNGPPGAANLALSSALVQGNKLRCTATSAAGVSTNVGVQSIELPGLGHAISLRAWGSATGGTTGVTVFDFADPSQSVTVRIDGNTTMDFFGAGTGSMPAGQYGETDPGDPKAGFIPYSASGPSGALITFTLTATTFTASIAGGSSVTFAHNRTFGESIRFSLFCGTASTTTRYSEFDDVSVT